MKLRTGLAMVIVAVAAAGTVAAAAAASPGGASPGAAAGDHDHDHDHGHLIRPVVTTDADWAPLVTAIGRTGKLSPDGLSYRVGFPRRDLTVTSYGVTIKPSFALGGYTAFARYSGGHAMLMGDLVASETEASAVTDALQAGGIAQTAIHKHLLAESPPLWWMHINATGDPVSLARAVKAAVDKTATPPPAPPSPPGTVDLDTAGIDAALAAKGTVDGGVYKFTFARRETITEDRHVIPPGLGVTTALNFQPLGGGAAINGDFAMTADEVQHLIAALRRGGITVVSLHNHALDDAPRLFYTHFWATGDGVALAKALRAALDQTGISR